MAMEFMIVITLTLATSYLATAAPFNVTNSSLCFCRADKDASDGDTYQSLIASLNSLYSYCTFPNMVSFINSLRNYYKQILGVYQ